MKLAMIGLGRMGANMARRLMRGGHTVVVFDLDPTAVADVAADGAIPAESLEDAYGKLEGARVFWVMVPCGAPTEHVVQSIGALCQAGDLIVDGGNSFFKDDVRRAKELATRGVLYADAGTSGGVWGLERGYCLMVGAAPEAFALLEPALRTLAPGQGDIEPSAGRTAGESTAEEGYMHCGGVGAGHFVKMIHNGIEYGLMQAYGEGFDILKDAGGEDVPEDIRYDINLGDVAELWRRGSVVGSWLLDLTAIALAESPTLGEYSGFVSDSGEGRWTVQSAIEQSTPAPVLTASLFARFRSRRNPTFADRVLSAMRKQFGGHIEPGAK